MQTELTGTFSPFDLTQAAREFASEVGATAERKKKPISSPGGLRTFFLYIRAVGYVPPHQVSGAITVQTILGAARLSAEGKDYELPAGSVVFFPAGVLHDVSASEESVLLITQASQD